MGTNDDVGALQAKGIHKPVFYGLGALPGEAEVIGIVAEEVGVTFEDAVHLGVAINEHAEFHQSQLGVLLELGIVELKEEIAGEGGPPLIELIDIEIEITTEFGIALHEAIFLQAVGAADGGILEKGVRIGDVCGDTALLDDHATFSDFSKNRVMTAKLCEAGLHFGGLEWFEKGSVLLTDLGGFEWLERDLWFLKIRNDVDLGVVELGNQFLDFGEEVLGLLGRGGYLGFRLGRSCILGDLPSFAHSEGLRAPLEVR